MPSRWMCPAERWRKSIPKIRPRRARRGRLRFWGRRRTRMSRWRAPNDVRAGPAPARVLRRIRGWEPRLGPGAALTRAFWMLPPEPLSQRHRSAPSISAIDPSLGAEDADREWFAVNFGERAVGSGVYNSSAIPLKLEWKVFSSSLTELRMPMSSSCCSLSTRSDCWFGWCVWGGGTVCAVCLPFARSLLLRP